MSKKSNKWTKSQKITTAVITGVILLSSFFITYARDLNIDFLPSWRQIHAYLGLQGEQVSLESYPFSVHFIDVGQGDCSLIVSGENAVLIDGGERENSEEILSYIYDLGLKKLDCIVATHPHSDHIGGLIGVLEKFPVEEVLLPRLSESNTPTTRVYEDLLNGILQSGAKVFAAKPGDKYEYGEIKYTVLAPFSQDSNLNNMSVVLRMEYEDTSFLFTGDAESRLEYSVLDSGADIQSDVLKVAHHGSNTSSEQVFLKEVKAKYAVISCGLNNSYGHPHDEVVSRLRSVGSSIYRTDKSGNIVFALNEEGIAVFLENE